MSEQNKQLNRCLYLDQHHQLTLVSEAIPKPKPDEVLVAIKANGICGSDIHFFKEGRLGNFVVDRPYIPGHEASGEIAACGHLVKHVSPGDKVVLEPGIPCGRCSVCRGGRYNLCPDVIFLSAPPVNGTFCDYLTIRADAVFKMPDHLSFADAAMAEPAAVAIHAVNRASFSPGASALIVGAGPIGLMTLQAFMAAGGGQADCLDLQEKRLAVADGLGAGRFDAGSSNRYDVVFDTSGSAKACAALFSHARPGACVVQVGWPAGNDVTMNIADFIEKELDYVGVNRYANAFPTAIQWLADGRIKTKPLLTHTFTLEEAPEAFKKASESVDVIKAIVMNDCSV